MPDVQGVRLQNADIRIDQPRVAGYNVKTTMVGILRGLRHLCVLRGFPMSPTVSAALRHYTLKVLHRKVCTGLRFCLMAVSWFR